MGLGMFLFFCLFKIESAHGHLDQTSMLQALTLSVLVATRTVSNVSNVMLL